MRSFTCPVCGQLLFFENTECLSCGTRVGFDPATRDVVPLGDRYWCAQRERNGCNWLVDRPGWWCPSCLMTRGYSTDPDDQQLLTDAEQAKRRVVFQLGELGLPLDFPRPDGGSGPLFDLLRGTPGSPVTIGHANGIITIDLAEGDDVRREKVRQELGEPYRTMLGHVRHEIGHYYWPLLVSGVAPDGTDRLARFRELFGDERADYAAEIARHYADGPPPDWQADYVSAYATMHPWEDWAETWAQYLHLLDTLQTAQAFGLHHPEAAASAVETDDHLDQLIAQWLPLSYALNQVNRSMGQSDLYPFVLTPPVLAKMRFIDECVRAMASAPRPVG